MLAQAIRDIYSPKEEERSAVIMWLGQPDFVTVCEYASVEPGMMMEQMASLARMPLSLAKKYGTLLRVEVLRGVYHG